VNWKLTTKAPRAPRKSKIKKCKGESKSFSLYEPPTGFFHFLFLLYSLPTWWPWCLGGDATKCN
jgi:hypothetical protein